MIPVVFAFVRLDVESTIASFDGNLAQYPAPPPPAKGWPKKAVVDLTLHGAFGAGATMLIGSLKGDGRGTGGTNRDCLLDLHSARLVRYVWAGVGVTRVFATVQVSA